MQLSDTPRTPSSTTWSLVLCKICLFLEAKESLAREQERPESGLQRCCLWVFSNSKMLACSENCLWNQQFILIATASDFLGSLEQPFCPLTSTVLTHPIFSCFPHPKQLYLGKQKTAPLIIVYWCCILRASLLFCHQLCSSLLNSISFWILSCLSPHSLLFPVRSFPPSASC